MSTISRVSLIVFMRIWRDNRVTKVQTTRGSAFALPKLIYYMVLDDEHVFETSSLIENIKTLRFCAAYAKFQLDR